MRLHLISYSSGILRVDFNYFPLYLLIHLLRTFSGVYRIYYLLLLPLPVAATPNMHLLHSVECGILLQTSFRGVVCMCVRVLGTPVIPAKMDEPIKMSFGEGADSRGSN